MSSQIISDLHLRAYFASVIGGLRQPYGRKDSIPFGAQIGVFKTLAQNATRDRVLSVLVTRSDLGGGTPAVAFTQNSGGAGSSDFAVNFATNGSQRFILYPGDSLTLQMNSAVAAVFVIQQETW